MDVWFGRACTASSSATNLTSSISGRRGRRSSRNTPTSSRTKTKSSAPPASSTPFARRSRSKVDILLTLTLQEIATLSGGELLGDAAMRITGAASLGEATSGEISFFGNPKYAAQLRKTQASAIFVPRDFAEETPAAQVRVAIPAKAFEQVVMKFAPEPLRFAPGVHPS